MSSRSEMKISYPSEDTLLINVSGTWKLGNSLPSVSDVSEQINEKSLIRKIAFDTRELSGWDSGLLIFLKKIIDRSSQYNVHVLDEGLPSGVQRLLSLAAAVPGREDSLKGEERISLLERIGEATIDFKHSLKGTLLFTGEAFVAFLKLLRGKARFQRSEFFLILQESGAQALPIVSLISLLVGLILAFIGAIQLRLFGAQIYVADLVGIGIVREMGAIMTGIIMAGRTGAAFAARLGTMQVNEEIDALKTLGISPMEFLVLPRMLALILMLPLLTLYADLMGVIGGLLVGIGVLDLNFMEYYNQTVAAVSLNDLWIGIFMGAVFGFLVAFTGCLRGIQCGRSASEVGKAATSAVVSGIVSIVIATAIITIICNILGI